MNENDFTLWFSENERWIVPCIYTVVYTANKRNDSEKCGSSVHVYLSESVKRKAARWHERARGA